MIWEQLFKITESLLDARQAQRLVHSAVLLYCYTRTRVPVSRSKYIKRGALMNTAVTSYL
jgi:hypothetical protein